MSANGSTPPPRVSVQTTIVGQAAAESARRRLSVIGRRLKQHTKGIVVKQEQSTDCPPGIDHRRWWTEAAHDCGLSVRALAMAAVPWAHRNIDRFRSPTDRIETALLTDGLEARRAHRGGRGGHYSS